MDEDAPVETWHTNAERWGSKIKAFVLLQNFDRARWAAWHRRTNLTSSEPKLLQKPSAFDIGRYRISISTSLFIDKWQIIPIWLTEWQHSRLIQPFPHHSDAVKTPNCTSTACLKPSGFPQEFGKKHLSSTFCLLSLMHRGHWWQNSPQSATASPPCWTPATAHTFTHNPCCCAELAEREELLFLRATSQIAALLNAPDPTGTAHWSFEVITAASENTNRF